MLTVVVAYELHPLTALLDIFFRPLVMRSLLQSWECDVALLCTFLYTTVNALAVDYRSIRNKD